MRGGKKTRKKNKLKKISPCQEIPGGGEGSDTLGLTSPEKSSLIKVPLAMSPTTWRQIPG